MTESSKIEFPCEFPIKIFCKNNSTIESRIRAILDIHLPNLPVNAIVIRPSGNDKYIAFTVTFIAESKNQLDQIYQSLTFCEDVVMVL